MACAHAVPAPSGAREAIVLALDDFNDAAAKADEARYFAHFAPDGVFVGTDATERWDKPSFQAYAHPHFAKGKAWSFKGINRRIAIRGDIAWFEEDLETANLGPARGSGVLVFVEGHWLLEQYVLSSTIPNDKFAAVKALLAK
jgi:SnoaL-like domain